MLALRRGVVTSAEAGVDGPALDRLVVEVAEESRPAVAYRSLTGPTELGDEVLVNVAAVDLGLGSGGFDLVHANLSRGLGAPPDAGARVMKQNYTSIQHGVRPVEVRAPAGLGAARGAPVAVIALHAQLPCVAWAAGRVARGARIGYVQTWGGALPGALSDSVRELRERGLLAGHVSAGAAFGAEEEAITVHGAIHAGLTSLGWDAAIVGAGPGVLGSGTALGHGGLAALDAAHAALSLGARTVLVPRMSSGDRRPRHDGLSHHTATVLELLLRPVLVAVPEGRRRPLPGGHRTRLGRAELDGYAASGLPASTMGRGMSEDPLFFRAALAGGDVLGELVRAL